MIFNSGMVVRCTYKYLTHLSYYFRNILNIMRFVSCRRQTTPVSEPSKKQTNAGRATILNIHSVSSTGYLIKAQHEDIHLVQMSNCLCVWECSPRKAWFSILACLYIRQKSGCIMCNTCIYVCTEVCFVWETDNVFRAITQTQIGPHY